MTNKILLLTVLCATLVIMSMTSFHVRFAFGKYFYTDIQIQTPIVALIAAQTDGQQDRSMGQ